MCAPPHYCTLKQLLTNRLFRIPHSPRAYSWHDQHRNTMFKDILKLRNTSADSFHFMATVVGLKRPDRTIAHKVVYKCINIIDGQQRITTLVLLLKAIELKLNETPNKSDRAEELQKLLVKEDKVSLILLQTNYHHSQHYANFLKFGSDPSEEEPKTLADQELLKAIQDCKSFVDQWNDPIELLGIVMDKLTFVYHEVDNEEVVYTIFETLNDTGLDVSWMDRLKNRLMSIVLADNQGNNDEHIENLHNTWKDIYATIGLHEKLNKEVLIFGAALTSLDIVSKFLSEEDAVENLVDRSDGTAFGVINVSRWILQVTEAFNKFFQYTNSSKRAVAEIVQARLLGIAIFLRNSSQEEKEKLLEEWEKTTFRIFGLCRTHGNKEKSEYVRLAWETVNIQEFDASEILNRLKDLGANYNIDQILVENRNCYRGWEEKLRYLLFRYEEHLAQQQGRTISNYEWIDIWKYPALRSIEHILPQSKGSKVPLKANQEGIFVHRLGNLLLLPLDINVRLRDKDPKEKAHRYQDTGFLMAKEVAQTIDAENWGLEQIEERERNLIEWIREKWG